jgi:DNA polymerase-3 subunit delta'
VEGERLEASARVAAGRLDRADRLLEPEAEERRRRLLGLARAVYLDERFDPAAAAAEVLELARARGSAARATAETTETGDETPREREQRLRRAARGAEREDVLDALDLLSGWYRDLVVAAAGADGAVLNTDRLAELHDDALAERAEAAGRAAEIARDSWRTFEEFNVQSGLALEALFVRLRRELHERPVPVR